MDLNNTTSWKFCEVFNSKSRHPIDGKFSPKAFYINYIIIIVFNIILAVLTISLNLVTILAYWKSAHLRRKSSYFLIMLLSITDFATGLFGNAGFMIVMAIKVLKQDPDCLMFTLLELLAFCVTAMSFMTSFLLNAERYLGIVHPFFHRRIVTKSKLLVTAVILWSGIPIFVVTSRIVFNRITKFLSSIVVLLIVIACIYFYVAIYVANQKARKRSRAEEVNNRAGKIAQDIKLAKSCTIVIACTIVCFVPFAATNPIVTRNYLKYSLRNWACTLAFASASLNSLVFFWWNPALRNEARKVLVLCI